MKLLKNAIINKNYYKWNVLSAKNLGLICIVHYHNQQKYSQTSSRFYQMKTRSGFQKQNHLDSKSKKKTIMWSIFPAFRKCSLIAMKLTFIHLCYKRTNEIIFNGLFLGIFKDTPAQSLLLSCSKIFFFTSTGFSTQWMYPRLQQLKAACNGFFERNIFLQNLILELSN